MTSGALSHLRVLDLTQRFGYASKLFADLGAEVILVEPPGGIEARRRGPFLRRAGQEHGSLNFQYLGAGKQSLVLDLDDRDDRASFSRLVASADVVFDDRLQSARAAHGLGYAALAEQNAPLVWCAITWFGQTGPRAGDHADDFTSMAAGGMAWLTGYDDTGPLVTEGQLAIYAAAQYAAVMSLVAVLGRLGMGGGQFIDVSVQEVVALGTETAPQFYDLQGVTRRRAGERERQAGIGLYPCRDGHVLLYAADSGLGTGWFDLVQWLLDAGIAEAACLHEPQWRDNAFKASEPARRQFRELFVGLSKLRGKQQLFEEGQRRHIAIAPINDAAACLADPHFAACGFFTKVGEIDHQPVTGPGAPYHLSATPWRVGARAPHLGEHTVAPRDVDAAERADIRSLPLSGIRVIDFTWVGAGPFTTKILADFGAEVIKIESATRPDQLRRAEPLVGGRGLNESGYFAVRNTNKRSVTIDMKQPGARELILALARGADVMANSFSPRAMGRFGLSYADVASVNPGLVYLSMPMAGARGPYRDYIGYGMSIAAIIGMYAAGGRAGRRPVGTGTNYPDHLPNPLHATFAVLAALAHRARTGAGQEIMMSQLESTLAAFPDAVLAAAANGISADVPAPQGIYRCAGDDRWCAISVADDAMFAALGRTVGRPVLQETCFATASSRRQHAERLDAEIAAWAVSVSAEAAAAQLQAAGVAAAVVATPRDLLSDAHLAERGFWQWLDHPVMGRSLYHGIAAHFSATPTAYRRAAPLLGEHNSELPELARLDADVFAAFVAKGVIR